MTKIEFLCTEGHRQVIEFHHMPAEQALFTARLMDGTSPAYKFPPGPESTIGKCGICGKQISSRVLDEPRTDSPGDAQSSPSASGA